ncbi:hypothetical protein P8918_13390 [Bacillus spizizenii]|nr:hypothetical protein [Bacillus spizizenii]MCY8890562.1 hypothetical protein [Bacillus spizizenii]MEC0842021.1 hypothetical protein [Bacillus spizizenii]
MQKLKEKLLALIGIRKIIALSLTAVFCYLTVVGLIGKDEFLPVFSMVVGYYFGRSTALDKSANIGDKPLG